MRCEGCSEHIPQDESWSCGRCKEDICSRCSYVGMKNNLDWICLKCKKEDIFEDGKKELDLERKKERLVVK